MRRQFLALLVAMLVASSVQAEPVTLGPFQPRPATTLYLVSDGQPCAVKVTYAPGPRKVGDRLLTRLFDADEKLVFWQYDKPQPDAYPVELSMSLSPQEGVHQLRIVAGKNDSLVTVQLERPLPFGVCGQLGALHAWNAKIAEAWVYVPPKATIMDFSGGPVQVQDESGATLVDLPKPKSKGHAPVSRHRTLLRLRFPKPGEWSLNMRGFPLIVCPSKDAARTIHGSVEELPDGTVVHHKFQVRIAKLLPELLKPDKIGQAADLVASLKSRESEWLENPLRNQYLLGSYGFMEHINWSVRMQDVNPASPTSGAITLEPGKQWYISNGPTSFTEGALAAGLARAALLDVRFNPYFGKKELLWRAAACALRDLMLVNEDETFKRGVSSDMGTYPTVPLHFPLAHCYSEVFAVAAPHMPPEIRQLWAQALQHPVDRMFPCGMVSCRNQSAHGMVILWQYFLGSGDSRYRDMANDYGDRFFKAMTKGCFDMEACGPDATYQGMTDWNKGYFYAMSHHPATLESLRCSYRFFGHTVAPEPDGRILGASNFSHRTAGNFAEEQYGGAKGICDAALPEIGVWAKPATDQSRAKAAEFIRKRLARPFSDKDYTTPGGAARGRHGSYITTPRYLYYTEQPLTMTRPALEPKPFIRNFADELIAVKRPGYYCAVYVGKPAGDFYIRSRKHFRKPLPDDVENKGGKVTCKPVTPFLGGGLSLFWTPQYGNALLAMCWSPLTHHGIVVRMNDATRWWEDYHATQFKLDEAAGALTITGKVEGQPLAYVRRYAFNDDALDVALTITATADFASASMIENVPIVLGKAKPKGAKIQAPDRGTAFRVVDKTGKGVEWAFAAEHAFTKIESGMHYGYGKHEIGRVEVALPASLKKGAQAVLRYRMAPVTE